MEALRPRLAVRRDRVAAYLGDTCEIGAELALDGVQAVEPGQLWRDADAAARTVWSPSAFANAPVKDDVGDAELQAELRSTVRSSLAAFADLGRPLLGEMSGGLDSAVMAWGLSGRSQVRGWLHVHAGDREADERRYARDLAARLGIELTERDRTQLALGSAGLDDIGVTARPALSAMDAGYEATVVEAVEAAQAWGVVTGQGGDTVFYSMVGAGVAADPDLCRGLAAQRALVRSLAKATRTSLWRIAHQARVLQRRAGAWPTWSPLLGAHRDIEDIWGRGPTHPWVKAAAEASAAKRLQVQGLAYNQLACNDCRRSRAARLIHGPMLQPVMELCLRIPARRLVQGGRDRALVRGAFDAHLPASIVGRRGKGDLTRVYGLELATSLPFVRERLLGGRLRDWGLLDLPLLEDRLTAESLMWRGGYADLMELLAIETWARAIAPSPV